MIARHPPSVVIRKKPETMQMSETVYTVTRTFSNLGTRVLSVDAGTGSVTVAAQHGTDNFIDMKTYSADEVEVIEFTNRTYRFTVVGDATYAL